MVPIALGKYLFPFRTQKSSPVAPIILLCGKLGRCQIVKNHSERGDFFVAEIPVPIPNTEVKPQQKPLILLLR